MLGDGRVTWSHPHHLCLPQHDYSIEERQDFSYPPHEDRSITHDEDSRRRMGDKDEAGHIAMSHGMAEKVGDDWSWSCDVPVRYYTG